MQKADSDESAFCIAAMAGREWGRGLAHACAAKKARSLAGWRKDQCFIAP